MPCYQIELKAVKTAKKPFKESYLFQKVNRPLGSIGRDKRVMTEKALNLEYLQHNFNDFKHKDIKRLLTTNSPISQLSLKSNPSPVEVKRKSEKKVVKKKPKTQKKRVYFDIKNIPNFREGKSHKLSIKAIINLKIQAARSS